MSDHEVRFPAGTFTQEEARAYVVADRLVAAAREEVEQRYAPLVEAYEQMLSAFWIKCHPGYHALRTNPIRVETVKRWRAALADLGEGQPERRPAHRNDDTRRGGQYA